MKNQRMLFRISVAALLFASMFYFVGWAELLEAASALTWIAIIKLLFIAVVMIWISCVKWQLFLRASGNDPGILYLMKLYTIGYFFSNFAPSIIGGDIVRSYQLGKRLENQNVSFSSTYLERFTGLLAMTLLGTIAVALGSSVTSGLELAILAVSFAVAVLALVSFSTRVHRLAFNFAGLVIRSCRAKQLEGFVAKCDTMIETGMQPIRTNTMLFVSAMLLSLVFNVLTVVNTYIAAQAVGWEQPDVGALFVVVPLVLIVSMAPITPSGIGIQEGAFLFFLMRIGATKGQGLGVGIVLRLKVLLIALLGGLLWLRGERNANQR